MNVLVGFGHVVGPQLFAQAPSLGDVWVMDIAINSDTGEPVVIELNPAHNSGLYASQPRIRMQYVHRRIRERTCAS
ncbi:hypothetical protein CQ018_08310 [Arthrobacter sp. MYb227]|nr:hypothetical protein CQ018_08310 [Arthrobacter sp. MYb227]